MGKREGRRWGQGGSGEKVVKGRRGRRWGKRRRGEGRDGEVEKMGRGEGKGWVDDKKGGC